MGLFGFGKKKENQEIIGVPGLPVNQIMVLKQRGMSTDQIIPELERQGYNSSQIFDALNRVNISEGNIGQTPQNLNMPQQELPPELQDFSPVQQQSSYASTQFGQPMPQQPQISKDQIEEIAEAIIDEKWKEFEEDIQIVVDWKEKAESKIDHLEQQIKDLTNSLDSLHKSLINKISEYDRNIIDVGTEMKAMEKVFQKVLPGLTENVNKLERMTKQHSRGKK